MVIDTGSHVVVTDIKIPFASLVILLVKWAFAAIPALLIVLLVARAFRWLLRLLMGTA
jgi:hypothetical protein